MAPLLFVYIFTEVLAPFFASLLILGSILFLGRLIPILGIIFELGIGLADFVRICAYLTPRLLLFSIPMASMMAVIIGFTRMANDNEIMALKASGVGLSRMSPPVMAFALLTSLATLWTSTTLAPRAATAMNQLFLQLAKEKIDRGVSPGRFSEGLGNVVLYVEKVDPDNRTWEGVYLSDLRNREVPVTVLARRGSLAADIPRLRITLDLQDGVLHRAEGKKTQTMRFASYTLTLPIRPPTTLGGENIAHRSKNTMTQAELLTAAQAAKTPNERNGYLIEHHQRLALPVGCLVLTLLGLPFTMVGRPRHRAVGIPLGLLSFIGYYVLLTAAKAYAEGGVLPVSIAMWLPNLAFAILLLVGGYRVARELDISLAERILDTVESLKEGLRRTSRRKER